MPAKVSVLFEAPVVLTSRVSSTECNSAQTTTPRTEVRRKRGGDDGGTGQTGGGTTRLTEYTLKIDCNYI